MKRVMVGAYACVDVDAVCAVDITDYCGADTAPQALQAYITGDYAGEIARAETGRRIDLAKLTKDPNSTNYSRPRLERKTPHDPTFMETLRKDADARIMEAIAQRMWSTPQPDAVAVNPERLSRAIAAGKIDPLDVEYDGQKLRDLLVWDEARRRETHPQWRNPTPAQRAAISAHWSAQLRARTEAAKQAEREQVVREIDDDGE